MEDLAYIDTFLTVRRRLLLSNLAPIQTKSLKHYTYVRLHPKFFSEVEAGGRPQFRPLRTR